MMFKEYFLDSAFDKTKTSVFHYPPAQEASDSIFLLKGLYGEHVPLGNSWDNNLVSLLQKDHHVICIKTGRSNVFGKMERFHGKTFIQECSDVSDAFLFARNQLLPRETRMQNVSLSFGGTTLLGVPSMLQAMETVIFIGSGSGRNPATKKPLLETMPETDDLLSSIRSFNNTLIFLRGGLDETVPLESQKKIFLAAEKTSTRAWIEYQLLGHELDDSSGSKIPSIANQWLRNFYQV